MALVKVARFAGKDCGIRRTFTVAKGPQRHRINLARRIARQAIATGPDALKGWPASIEPGEGSAFGRLSLPQEAASLRYGEGKVLYLLTFMTQAGCAHFSISLGKTLPFPRHTFA